MEQISNVTGINYSGIVTYRYDPVKAVYYGINQNGTMMQPTYQSNVKSVLTEDWKVVSPNFTSNKQDIYVNPLTYPEDVYIAAGTNFTVGLLTPALSSPGYVWPEGSQATLTVEADASSSTVFSSDPHVIGCTIDVSKLLAGAVLVGSRYLGTNTYISRYIWTFVGTLVARTQLPRVSIELMCNHPKLPTSPDDSMTVGISVYCSATATLVRKLSSMNTSHNDKTPLIIPSAPLMEVSEPKKGSKAKKKFLGLFGRVGKKSKFKS